MVTQPERSSFQTVGTGRVAMPFPWLLSRMKMAKSPVANFMAPLRVRVAIGRANECALSAPFVLDGIDPLGTAFEVERRDVRVGEPRPSAAAKPRALGG